MPSLSSSDESDHIFSSHYSNATPTATSTIPHDHTINTLDDGDGDDQDDDSASSSSDDDPTSPHNHYPPPTFFAPPFYGRPPTPLPPSPSLTSLLRPSRPTTPDSSDHDLPGSNSGLDLHLSSRVGSRQPSGSRTGLSSVDRNPRTPIARASPKVPTYEYYGFVLYLFSSLVFLFYILWSYLPSPFLHQLGIHYYPNRWWSLAIPSWLVAGLVYIYVALASCNTGMLTLRLGDVETVVDACGKIASLDGKGRVRPVDSSMLAALKTKGEGERHGGRDRERREKRERDVSYGYGSGGGGGKRDWKALWSEGTDAVMDVPLGGVCEVLYGEGRVDVVDDDDEEV